MSTLSLEDLFLTDTKAEENGTWVELTPTMKFMIRSYTCKAAVDLREKLQKPHVALLRVGKLPEETSKDINLKILSQAILADWSMMSEDEDGNPTATPFSSDAAYAMMKRMPRFADWVAQQAVDTSNYQEAVLEDSVKN